MKKKIQKLILLTLNYNRVLVFAFASLVAPKRAIGDVSNRSLKQIMVAFLAQENITQHRIYTPSLSCLQYQRKPVTSTVINSPQARRYQAILKCSHGRWPIVSS